MDCPRCGKKMHVVCSNKECACFKSIPAHEWPMTHHWQIGPLMTPVGVGNALWRFWWWAGLGDRIHPSRFMLELERCPYCWFTESVDYWFERSCDEAFAERRQAASQ